MQGGVVEQVAVGTQPHLLTFGANAAAGERIDVHVAQVDRPRAVEDLAQLCLQRRHPLLEVGKGLGRGHFQRAGGLVVEACLGHVEAGLQVEDRPPVLDRHHTAGGEALAVADAVDVVEDRLGG